MAEPVWGDEGQMRPIQDIPHSQLEADGNSLGEPDDENFGGIGLDGGGAGLAGGGEEDD